MAETSSPTEYWDPVPSCLPPSWTTPVTSDAASETDVAPMTPEIAPESPNPGAILQVPQDRIEENNQTSRQMTPVYHYADGGTLWLGGQTAANNLDMLYLNCMLELWDIDTKEHWACRRAKGIEDMFLHPPSRIDDTRLSYALVG